LLKDIGSGCVQQSKQSNGWDERKRK